MKNLKPIALSALVAVLLLSGLGVFAAGIVATPNNYEGKVSIEAVDIVKKRNIPVTVKILNPDVSYTDVLSGKTSLQNAAAYIGEVYSEKEGEAVVVNIPAVVMPENAATDTYKVIVSVDGSKNYETEFSYINFRKIKGIFTSINNITEEDADFDLTLNTLLTANDKILGINIDEYANLAGTSGQNAVHKELKKHTFATDESEIGEALVNFRKVFEEEAAFAALENYSDLTKIENNLRAYQALYAIDFSEYDKLEQSNSRQRVLGRIMNTDFEGVRQVAEIFNEQVILEKISVAAYGEIYSLITSNNQMLNVPLNYMDKIYDYNKDKVFMGMIGGSYNDKQGLTAAFKASVDNVYASQQGGGGSSGGGGGGSAGTDDGDVGFIDWNIPEATEEPKATEAFADIEDVQWAKDAIVYLKKNNIVAGKGDNRFAPKDNVTRAEFVKMVVELFVKNTDYTSSQFSDVSEDDWFCDYISKGVSAGIISGVGNGLFKPNDNITRQDIAVILDRAVKKEGFSESSAFVDWENISDYAAGAVGRLNNAGVVVGDNNNCFNPKSFATRAEAAVMLYRMYLLD